MSYRLIIPPEIEHEITEVFDAFRSADHAFAFMRDLNVLFERIAERPLQFPVIYASMRRALLRHHDYTVFFELDVANAWAVVHALVHQHRDPARWPR